MSLREFIRDFFEPLSFLIYFSIFTYYGFRMHRATRHKMTALFYLVASGLMFIAARSMDNTHIYNVLYPLSAVGLGYYFFSILERKTKKRWWLWR